MKTMEFAKFIEERWDIHVRRKVGMHAPWTEDPILQKYRFCNVRREDDRVTKWIQDNWLQPHRSEPEVWFASVIARFVNWPETLADIDYPNNWNDKRARWFVEAVEQRQKEGMKAFTSAYMVRAIEADKVGGGKAKYLAELVFTPLWNKRKEVRAANKSLKQFHQRLLLEYGMGSFLAAQIVADTKHTDLLNNVPDWDTWAAPGPGSQRGLNRVLGRPVDSPWKPEDWLQSLLAVRNLVLPKLPRALRTLDAQNLQNCLCEFDKYERARLNTGRPKQNFTPSEEGY